MPSIKQLGIGAATLAWVGHAYAQASISKVCPSASSGICYQLNIPEATANSGTGDIFFSITAPTNFEWVGLGQGANMNGANFFVVYTSANGQNVTVSHRGHANHVEPEHTTNDGIELLEGSGVSNGMMTANIRCSNCNTWDVGSMDFTSNTGSWIHAERQGTPLASDDLGEEISFHSEFGTFDWDFASAKGGNEVNPFVANNAAVTSGDTSSESSSSEEPANFENIVRAHAVLAALAFVIVFPSGAILMRLASFSGLIWVHAGIQLLGYIMFIAAFGLGVHMAMTLDYTGETHAIIGYVIFALIILQPVGGLLHHQAFKKTGTRNLWSYGHLFLGRIAIILGMINGGLGLKLADDASNGARAAYGALAGIFGVAFIAAAAFGEYKKATTARSPQNYLQTEKKDGGSSVDRAS